MMKFCQISVLIYIGAASGNWSPFNLPMVPVDRATDGDESFSAIAGESPYRSLLKYRGYQGQFRDCRIRLHRFQGDFGVSVWCW
jgi:hypothetical protein